MTCVRRVALGIGSLLVAASPGAAQEAPGSTAAMDGQWHFVVAPYFWFSGLSGEASVGALPPVSIDASFADLIKDFDFGVQGHLEGRKDRFGFGLDLLFMNLGAPVADEELRRLGLEVDVKQLIGEGFAFYRAASGGRDGNPAHVDVLLGARYAGTRTRLEATTGAGTELAGESSTVDWVDLIAGVKARAPLGSKVAVLGRADIGGLGSELSWNLEGDVAWLVSGSWTVGAGWRHLDFDYEDDGEAAPRRLDLVYDGPRVWAAYQW